MGQIPNRFGLNPGGNVNAERFFERYFTRSPMDAVWREKLREDWKGRDIWKTGAELVEEGSNVVTVLE